MIDAYVAELMGIDSGLHNFWSVCNLAELKLVDMLPVVFLCGEKNGRLACLHLICKSFVFKHLF